MGSPKARYMREFMIEAVRMVHGGQSMAAVATVLGISPKTLHNWVKAMLINSTAELGIMYGPAALQGTRIKLEVGYAAAQSRH